VQLARTKNLSEVMFAELETILYGERDDAIYLDLAYLSTEGAGGLIPSAYLPYPAKQGRRVDEAGIRLPMSKTVAVDPRSGRLIPTRPHVQIAPGAISRLQEIFGGSGWSDRLSIREPTPVEVIFAPGSSQGPLQPVSRAFALYQLAGQTMNMPCLGDRAIRGLAKLVERSRCYGLSGGSPREMLQAEATALNAA